MYRKVPLSIGEYYHIYSRGVEKRKIFNDRNDYERFVKLLFFVNQSDRTDIRSLESHGFSKNLKNRKGPIARIGAYCLMPNHFHILVKESEEDGVSRFMRKLLTGYSMYFNKKYQRTGSLFGSVFHSKHIDSDEYFKYLFSYIHLNPAKLKDKNWRDNIYNNKDIFNFVCKYKYSSLNNYLEPGQDSDLILHPDEFPKYFLNKSIWENEIIEWLNFSDPI